MATSKERIQDWKIFESKLELLKNSGFDDGMQEAIPKLDVLIFVTAALDAYVGVDCWTAADAVALTKVVFEERDRELRRAASELQRRLEDDG